MPTPNTRDREEAVKSNVHKPYNPLLPFDKAIYKMIKNLYDETFYIDTQENAFTESARVHQGKVVLPMITVYRMGDYNVATDVINDWMVRQGYRNTVRGNDEFPDRRIAMHVVPVSLQYQIDVYATRRDVADGLTAELLMEFKEHPHFKAKIQDMGGGTTPIDFNFDIDDSVVDNSGITEFEDTGRFYRFTLTGNVPSAALTRVDIFDRIDRQTIELSDVIGKEMREQVINELSHQPKDTIVVTNSIDEYGVNHTREENKYVVDDGV